MKSVIVRFVMITGLVVFLSSCQENIDQTRIPVKGVISCTSPKVDSTLVFHTKDAKTVSRGFSDAYLSVVIDGAEVRLMQSEGWVCTDPHGTTKALFQT